MKISEKVSKLPLSPGCYLFKDKEGKVIYVGKAKQLRKRVSSYFNRDHEDSKTPLLVSRIADIDFVVTQNEVEALILENNLIKKYYPRYNIDLKDSRRYAYLKFHAKEAYPWVEVVRQREGEGEYYGPFVSGTMRKHIVDVLRRNFRILLKKPHPRVKKIIDKCDYAKRAKLAREILKGKVDEVIQKLEGEMKLSAKRKLYEHSLTRRNQILALKSLKEKQVMELKREVDAHIINYVVDDGVVYLLVFNVRKGILEGKQKFTFDYREDFLEEFITQFYNTTAVPQLLIVPDKLSSALEKYLAEVSSGHRSVYPKSRGSGARVKVLVPTRGEKKKLLDLVLKNVEATFFSGLESVVDLKRGLSLEFMPKHIECFDISHLGGTNTVASMVTFIDGKADKSKYRKFKIRTVEGIDDFMAMEEVIERRYAKTLSKTMKLPDLVIIDGGKGQLSSTLKTLEAIGVKVPVISLAKRLEEVFIPGKKDSIILDRKSKGLLLIRAIRDEAHRFAISYQRSLRSKAIRK